jgi:hypothetical protein
LPRTASWTAERHAAAKDLGSLSGAGKRDALAEIERLAKVLGDAHAALDVEIGRGDKVTGYVFTLAERIGSVLSGLREEAKRADDAEDKADRQAREIERLRATRATAEAERDDARADIVKAQGLLVKIGAPEHMIGRYDEDPRATLLEQIGALRHVFWSIATDGGKTKIQDGVPWADAAEEEARRLRADLLLLGALKSEEVAPVIERFREAFGADVPQAPSGKRATAEAERDDARRLVTLERRVGRWMSTEDEEALRRLRQEAREWDGSKVDPPVRHARHDRHCLIHDGVGCSREPGCEVEE